MKICREVGGARFSASSNPQLRLKRAALTATRYIRRDDENAMSGSKFP